jgi:hypothetical protein
VSGARKMRRSGSCLILRSFIVGGGGKFKRQEASGIKDKG